ncbi:hypothetical protein [Citrobacter sp. RHBSTW-00029]|uniref:hypothetical protein n=1 Tax=Citrobacter TaxID=544 RepID=UPI0015F7BA8C|nr:hypothetical protein [Citrobacter sp. RHBSTW-00029]MBA8106196.1 hypothetical protein [Citrobacter sp. RHBSTW-00029]
MSENNYGALMLKSALDTSVDLTKFTFPGVYPVISGNSSVPDSSAGLLIVSLTPSGSRTIFLKESTSVIYSLVSGEWIKPTASDVNAVAKSGDTMTGSLTLKGDYRLGFIIQNEDDSVRAYIFKDKGGDGVRISNGDDGGGDFVFGKNGQFYCPDIMHVGNTVVWGDGNIEGARWSGLLSDYINLRAPYEWVNQNFVNRVQRGAQASMTMDGVLVEAPAGCFLTGGNGNESNQIGIALYRSLLIFRNGGWVIIEG